MATKIPPSKKPITIMLSEDLHKKAKILAELSDTSLSELVEDLCERTVKSRLPALLASLMAQPTPAE
jgi:predicted HicB family RNase H-like nuclease